MRAASGLLSLAIIAFITAFVVVPGWRASSAWRRVDRALADDDLSLTRSSLEDYLRLRPSSGKAHFQLARVLRRQADFTAARRHLKEARRQQWPTVALDLEYKLLAAQAGGVRAAETTLHEYLEADHPESPLIFEALVVGYLRNNFLNDAHHWATAWNKRWPHRWRSLMLRGQVLERGLKLALAADDYNAALELNPNEPDIHHRLAQILLHLGKYSEALPHFEAFRAAHRDQPGGAPDPLVLAVVGQAKCLRALAQPDKARALIDDYLTEHEATAGMLLVRGQLDFDAERYQDALGWLRRAHELDPNDRELLQALANATRQLGQTEASAAYEKRRKEVEALVRKVESLIKDILAAETAHDPVKDWAKIVELRYQLGLTLLDLGKDAEASQWLLSALQLDPGHLAARKAIEAVKRRTKR